MSINYWKWFKIFECLLDLPHTFLKNKEYNTLPPREKKNKKKNQIFLILFLPSLPAQIVLLVSKESLCGWDTAHPGATWHLHLNAKSPFRAPITGLSPISWLVPAHYSISVTSHPTSQTLAEKSKGHFSNLGQNMFSRLFLSTICSFKPPAASVAVYL